MKSRAKRTIRKRPEPVSRRQSASPAPARASAISSGPGTSTGAFDLLLILLIVLLICIGIVMVFSASGVFSYVKLQDSTFFLKQQMKWLMIGGTVLLFTAYFDYRYYARVALPALAFVFVLLLLVPFVGDELNGAKRWLAIGGFRFHVGELAKTAMIIFMGVYLAAAGKRIKEFSYFAIGFGVFGIMAILLLMQPDFGMTGLIGLVVIGMMFVAGARPLHLATVISLGMVACVPIVMLKPYRLNRILGYLNPEADPLGIGWQKIQAMIAIANGGIVGRGLGDSIQKRMFLPQQHTDFIYSIIGEELGMIGLIFVAALFILLAVRGFTIANRVDDKLGKYLATGIVWMIALQAALNMGVAVGLFPVTGLTLPCISFGGASLTCTMLCLGILLNISTHTRKRRELDENHITGSGGDWRPHISSRSSRATRKRTRQGMSSLHRGETARTRAVGSGKIRD